MDGKGKGDGEGMVKGMSLIHVGVVSSLGHVASSPSSHVSSSPLCCRCMSYRGCVIVPCWHRLVVIFAGVVIASSLSSSCVVLACPGHVVLVLAMSSLSHIVVLCVNKVGWDEWREALTRVP